MEFYVCLLYTSYLNKIMDVGVEYDKEISLGTMMSPQGAIDISTKIRCV